MPRKKKVHLDTKTKEFILEKMREGLDISSIARKYPDKVPTASHIYKTIDDTDPEFTRQVNEAYGVLLMMRLDELHQLSSMSATEANPTLDWRESEAKLKRQIDSAKFILGKMAPILSNRFKQAQEVQVSGNIDNNIQVISYHKIVQELPNLSSITLINNNNDTVPLSKD